jgi:hypothetical protein
MYEEFEQGEPTDLERVLFNGDDSQQTTGTMGFTVDTPDKAAWAARKILQAEERIKRQNLLAETYRNRIEGWFVTTTKQDIETIEYLKSLLRPYAEKTILEAKRGKTVRFPGIALLMRKLPDRLEVTDEALAITHCMTHLEAAVEIKKTLIKSEVKRAIAAGSIIPGADIVPGNEELYVVDETEGATEHLKHAAA